MECGPDFGDSESVLIDVVSDVAVEAGAVGELDQGGRETIISVAEQLDAEVPEGVE